jgi:predicted lipid-binding transport protein (Tim44 family)
MGNEFQYADIFILAMIAGFILLRLRSTLGKNIGHDSFGQAPTKTKESKPKTNERIIQLPERNKPKPTPKEENQLEMASIEDPSLAKTVMAMRKIDAYFNPDQFIEGAKMAFEIVFEAYANGDKDKLKALLAADVFKSFEKEIKAREKSKTREETTIISIESVDISDIDLNNSTAQVNVTFVTEQITVVKNEEDEIVEGDPSVIERVEDSWSFERNLASRDPNWTIISTE